MFVIEVVEGDLLEEIRAGAKDAGITHAAVVSLIGAVDSFAVSTMPLRDATKGHHDRLRVPGRGERNWGGYRRRAAPPRG